ncbi:retrovirus-related pol polyprotein from transposon 17.6 [Tanacetum coccineum]
MHPKRTTTPMSDAAIKELVARSVSDALAEHEAKNSRNRYDSHDSETGSKRTERAARQCTYSDFLKCQPLNFKGTEGVNSYVKTVGHDTTYGMPWKTLKKMMTDKYCPRGEIKKLEIELWNLKVKGTDVLSYNQRFKKLALMCSRMFSEESDEVEKYVGGLFDMIQGSENKRKVDNDNQAQQQPLKKQNVARAYSAGSKWKKEYAETLPLCNKCKFHHNGPCTENVQTAKEGWSFDLNCRSPALLNNQRTRAPLKNVGSRALQK